MKSITWGILCLPVLFLSIHLFAFEYSGDFGLDHRYSDINEGSLLNKDNFVGMSSHDNYLHLNFSCDDEIFTDNLNYKLKVRGEKSYTDDYGYLDDDGHISEGSSFLVCDELYLTSAVNSSAYFALGRKRLSWGHGLIYNPVDFVNPMKRSDTSQFDFIGTDIAGVDLLFDTMSLGLYYNLELFANDNEFEYESSNLVLSFNHVIDRFEYTLYLLEKYKGDTIEKPSVATGVSYLVPCIDLSIYCDLIYQSRSRYITFYKSSDEAFDSYSKEGTLLSLLSGISYVQQTADLDYSFQLEYYYNGEGCSSDERDNYFAYLESQYLVYNYDQAAQIIGQNSYYYLGRHFVGMSIRLANIMSVIDFSTLVSYSLSDSSLLICPELEYNPVNNIRFRTYLTSLTGTSQSVYGATPALLTTGVGVDLVL